MFAQRIKPRCERVALLDGLRLECRRIVEKQLLQFDDHAKQSCRRAALGGARRLPNLARSERAANLQ